MNKSSKIKDSKRKVEEYLKNNPFKRFNENLKNISHIPKGRYKIKYWGKEHYEEQKYEKISNLIRLLFYTHVLTYEEIVEEINYSIDINNSFHKFYMNNLLTNKQNNLKNSYLNPKNIVKSIFQKENNILIKLIEWYSTSLEKKLTEIKKTQATNIKTETKKKTWFGYEQKKKKKPINTIKI